MDKEYLATVLKASIEYELKCKSHTTENIEDARKKISTEDYGVLMIEPYIFSVEEHKALLPLFLEEVKAKGIKVIAFTTQTRETLKTFYNLQQDKHYDIYLEKPNKVGDMIFVIKELQLLK